MRKWFVRTLAGVMATSLLTGSFAIAASTPSPTPAPGQGLEISPPIVEMDANPGQTVTTQVRIRNITANDLEVTGQVNDFGAGTDENGTPQLLLNETGTTRYSLKTWVTGVQNLLLAPQQLETATINIAVPVNAEPGGHYGVVRFSGVPPSLKGEGVALSASVGTLILLRVNGDVIDQLNVAEFAAGTQTGVDSWQTQSFFQHGPVNFLVRIHNTGTVHEQPQGTITVKNLFGHVVGRVGVNSKDGNILPDSYRRFVQTLPTKFLFGHYTATLAIKYDGTKTLAGTFGFWVIPWELILLILVALLVLGYLLRISIKKYNEHIIKMARRR
jgi:hypothetical protein